LSLFRDPELAARARGRLEEMSGLDLSEFFERAFVGNAAPDQALTNMERWLRATASPHLHLEQLAAMPKVGQLLVSLLGASQPIADSLIQNPELASLILEPSELAATPTREAVVGEGHRLLAAATSYSHSLDRLRFLRQRWTLPIVMNDLAGTWPQPVVWRALSDLADALIELSAHAAWTEYRKQREVPEVCPVLVVAFGKLGGHEVNYSSDVDLVYANEDGLDERLERDVTRYCESFGRALSDRMGRGHLYRVDLRLRPYGGAGPISRSMRAIEAYYQLYAEPWEVQALLRSRPVAGPPDLVARWEAMRIRTCFRPKVSEIALTEMVAMRDRIETGASEDDLKRGPGGIRDIEFLTQILQLVHGHARPSLRVLPTLDALAALENAGMLDHAVSSALQEGYAFLRRLEHRLQLVGDQQTHTLPPSAEARSALARMMDFADERELETALARHRRTIQALYRTTLNLERPEGDARERVLTEMGAQAPTVLQWFDVLPEREAFYAGLSENQDSLSRVRRLIEDAPRLVPYFKASVPLTELLMSGEIEEDVDVAARIERLPTDAPLRRVADTYSSAYATVLAQWTLNPAPGLGQRLSELMDALLDHAVRRLHSAFDVVATGSYGTREFGPGSDADVVLLVGDRQMHPEAERQAQELLGLLAQLKRLGAPVQVDLRLRPEGGKGLLVRTYEGFKAYELEGMELWERFALGHARLVHGNPYALAVVLHAAYGAPLLPESLDELLKMKRRIETERVKPQHVRRNVKLAPGGLNDIEWLIHLTEMRYPEGAGAESEMGDRIRRLVTAGHLNAVEGELITSARDFLLELRTRLYLLGIADDVLPENPDRLDRLAHSMGFESGNDFLSHHRQVADSIRAQFTQGAERLRS